MKIIKEKDMTNKVFLKQEISENTICIYRFENPEGYLFINKEKDRYSIFIHSLMELDVNDELKAILDKYINDKSNISVDSVNTKLIDYLKNNGHQEWYGYYSLHFEGEIKEMSIGRLQPYKKELSTYIDILGRCFEPMRTLHDFKPYNWYKSKKEEAKKEFEDAEKLNFFYGYVVDDQIVGAGIVDVDNPAVIDILAIKPEMQKKGLGRELLRGIVNEMKKSQKVIEIGVVESNQHVLKLYMSEGFIIDRYEKRFRNY